MNRFLPDPFIPAVLITLLLATLWPASGEVADVVGVLAKAAVMLLFFLHGAKLPRENLVAAVTHWRLHLLILGSTYLLFPVLGLALSSLFPSLLPANLWAGVLFLCALPSTVQMSIAFTAMARGNVAASVTSAALSNLLGVFLTPLIAGALLHAQGDGATSLDSIWKVVMQLLLPFAAGHLLRPLLAGWAARNKRLITWTDRLTILLAVYSAFSAAVIDGIWSTLPLATLLTLALVCATLLACVMLLTIGGSRILGLPTADRRSVQYCGSFKSLVSGVPIASVLFPSTEIGAMILPIMIYHQLQLMVSATVAPRQARKEQ
ncbi:MAG TPA: bile acid:sodium symporter family protein [Steroidobacteraceae bacterium]|nr:bile acid:sodium symporter family protein [Steroidobacteraceae bacterium]